MIDQNIGNPEITRKHLSELQTFYEAQLVAKRHYDALMTSLKPLQDAADVLRASGVVNVDALLSQPVSATKAMIDEMESEADADELNDLTPHEGEEEGETVNSEALDELFEADGELYDADAQSVEQEPEPAPAPELESPRVDHAAEATAQIEAQAEPESTETEAELPEWALLTEEEKAEGWKQVEFTGEPPEGIEDWTQYEVLFGNRCDIQYAGYSWGWHPRDVSISDADYTIIGYRLKPDTAETMQAIAEAVEAVDAEPEAATDETVTEQPETVEAEPETPDEPKAERKTLDCTDDYTQEEIVAKSGFDPRVQSDDIAAAEREEFRAYNPLVRG